MPMQAIEAQDEDIRPCILILSQKIIHLDRDWCLVPGTQAPPTVHESGALCQSPWMACAVWCRGKAELHYAKALAFSPMQHFSLSPGPTKMYYLVWTKLTLDKDEWLRFLEEMHGWMISDFAKTEKQYNQPFFCAWKSLSLSLWTKNSERPNWITEELDFNCPVL